MTLQWSWTFIVIYWLQLWLAMMQNVTPGWTRSFSPLLLVRWMPWCALKFPTISVQTALEHCSVCSESKVKIEKVTGTFTLAFMLLSTVPWLKAEGFLCMQLAAYSYYVASNWFPNYVSRTVTCWRNELWMTVCPSGLPLFTVFIVYHLVTSAG